MTLEEDTTDEKDYDNHQYYNTDDDVWQVALLFYWQFLYSPTLFKMMKFYGSKCFDNQIKNGKNSKAFQKNTMTVGSSFESEEWQNDFNVL